MSLVVSVGLGACPIINPLKSVTVTRAVEGVTDPIK